MVRGEAAAEADDAGGVGDGGESEGEAQVGGAGVGLRRVGKRVPSRCERGQDVEQLTEGGPRLEIAQEIEQRRAVLLWRYRRDLAETSDK